MSDVTKPTAPSDTLAVLPLRDIVVFPHMIVPLFVGRDKSVRALESVMKEDKQILLVAQKNAAQDDPSADDIYKVGTISTVLQLLKLPDGTVKVLVEGIKRARITSFKETEDYFEVFADPIEDQADDDKEVEALGRTVVSQFEQYIKLNKKIAPEVLVSVNQIDSPSKLADTVASHLGLKISDKQELLELGSTSERLERVFNHMESEIGVLQVEKKIRSRVKRQMEKTQREYYPVSYTHLDVYKRQVSGVAIAPVRLAVAAPYCAFTATGKLPCGGMLAGSKAGFSKACGGPKLPVSVIGVSPSLAVAFSDSGWSSDAISISSEFTTRPGRRAERSEIPVLMERSSMAGTVEFWSTIRAVALMPWIGGRVRPPSRLGGRLFVRVSSAGTVSATARS